jgi:hypothetical protein
MAVGPTRITLQESRELQKLQEILENPSVKGSLRLAALSEAVNYCQAGKLLPENFVEINPSRQIILIRDSFEKKGVLNEENEQRLLEISQSINQIVEQLFEKKTEPEFRALQTLSLPESSVLQILQDTSEDAAEGSIRLAALSKAVKYCQKGKLLVETFMEINPPKQILLIKEDFEKKGVLNEKNEQKLAKVLKDIHQLAKRVFQQNSERKKKASSNRGSLSWTFRLVRWTTNAAFCLFAIHKIAMMAGFFQEQGPITYSSFGQRSSKPSSNNPFPYPNSTNTTGLSPFSPSDDSFSTPFQCPAPQRTNTEGNIVGSPFLVTAPSVNFVNDSIPDLFDGVDSSLPLEETQYIPPLNPERSRSFVETTTATFQDLAQAYIPSWDHIPIPEVNLGNAATLGIFLFNLAFERSSSKTSF